MLIKRRSMLIFALLFILLSLTFVGWGISHFFTSHILTSVPKSVPPTHKISSIPIPGNELDMSNAHLLIPSIKVNAYVEQVGVAPDGAMAVPSSSPWVDVGWYKNGSLPGEMGSAVIDGHLDRPGATPAVFWNLNKMHIGDHVSVTDTQGHIRNFRVFKMQSYAPNNAPTNEIFNDKTGTYLNLITCAGYWIATQHQTSLRLVVYTKMI
jgi:LPXTG-site transpeptidase (sortase) family protein